MEDRDRETYRQYTREFNQLVAKWKNVADSEDEVQEWRAFYDRTGWNSALYQAAVTAYNSGNPGEAWAYFNKLTDDSEGDRHSACGEHYDALPGDEAKYDQDPAWSRNALCAKGRSYLDKIRQRWADDKRRAELAKKRKEEEATAARRQAQLEEQVAALNRKADEYRDAGHWIDAERLYWRSLALNPRQAIVWTYGLAYTLTQRQEWEAAFEAARRGCSLLPTGCPDGTIVERSNDAFSNMYYFTFANMQQAEAEKLMLGRSAFDDAEKRRCFALLRNAVKYDGVTGKSHPAARALLAAVYRASGDDVSAELQADIVLLQHPDDDGRDRFGAQMILDAIHRKDMEQLSRTGHSLAHWPNGCVTIVPDGNNSLDAGRYGCAWRSPPDIPLLQKDRIYVRAPKGSHMATEEAEGQSTWTKQDDTYWRIIVRSDGSRHCETIKDGRLSDTIYAHNCP